MRITASDTRKIYIATYSLELIAIAGMAFVLWLPIARENQILMCFATTILLLAVDRIAVTLHYERLKALENLWFNHLLLRFAFDASVQKNEHGGTHSIDWERATQFAIEDIRKFDASATLEDEVSSGKTVDYLSAALVIPSAIAIRLGIAWVLAQAAEKFLGSYYLAF